MKIVRGADLAVAVVHCASIAARALATHLQQNKIALFIYIIHIWHKNLQIGNL